MGVVDWTAIALTGLAVGLLAGLFGKGGSAVATPLLHAAGVPALIAVAAPLPATIPSTLVASRPYWRQKLVDDDVLRWSLLIGVPATIAGAVASRWVSGDALVRITDLVVAALGVRFLLGPSTPEETGPRPAAYRTRLVLVAAAVGLAAGLLANSGGFLLAPLYLVALRMPVRSAFATSLTVAAFLAVPGTIVHWSLGHIDWTVVAVFGVASVPCSYLGAQLALRIRPHHLERVYGAILAALGLTFLLT
jgi:uncharacterized membrane protein YfcA